MKIILVSSNPGKIQEIKLQLKKFGIKVIAKKMEVPEIRSDKLEEISKEKARIAAKKTNRPVIVDDTGFYFNAYKNFPGAYARFIFNAIGFNGILKLLKGESRNAYFKSVIAYCKPRGRPKIFSGICKGKITKNVKKPIIPRLPYDSIFIPDDDRRTFSQMTKEEKAKYSHRAKAAEKFARWFIRQK